MDDANYLLYRATRTLRMPEGFQPDTLLANQTVAVHQALLGHEGFQQMVRSGMLIPEPARPAPITETKIAGFLPTAEEIITALKEHPDIYEQVKQHFHSEIQAQAEKARVRMMQGAVAEPRDRTKRELQDLLKMVQTGTLSRNKALGLILDE